MIGAFRVKNLRAIEDSGIISLKKINVLVGRNSSGKSTILRLLPLLRQSVEQPTKGPLLWYGRLVDFGDFKNAARDGDTVRGITLEFKMRVVARRGGGRYQFISKATSLARSTIPIYVSIVLGLSEDDRVGKVRSIKIISGSDEAVIEFSANGGVSSLIAMGDVIELTKDQEWGVSAGEIIPMLAVMYKTYYEDGEGNVDYDWDRLDDPFLDRVVKELGRLAHGNTSEDRLVSIAGKIIYSVESPFSKHVMDLASGVPSLQIRLQHLGEDSSEFRDLRRAVFINWIFHILRAVDEEIAQFARNVRYLEPIRASAERYYREQDLAVDEVDSRGTNTAMFLSSLSDRAMRSLQLWMQKNLGFMVHVEASTGHIQIKISASGKEPRNMADLGFGYSQLLPIILQLWNSTRLAARNSIVAIEQPELHLHPQYQALLADVIGATSSRAKVVIETHSDHFINRLGLLVSQGLINSSDVQVIVVSDGANGVTTVCPVPFDQDGVLGDNWPVGFFTPDVQI